MASSLLLRPRRYALLAASCAAVVVPIAGCGDSGSSSSSGSGADAGADPAALLPASTPVYVEAQLRPTGELAGNAKTVVGKILRTADPGGKIVGLIDDAIKDNGVTYKKDIEPWLGQRAGIAITSVGAGSDVQLVGAIASKDDDAAKKFVERQAKGTTKKYRDVEYRFKAGDDLAAAVVDHAVLIGTEKAFKSAVDAEASGSSSLATAGAFKKARSTVGTDGLGFVYADPSRFFDLALGAASGSGAMKSSDAQSLQAFKGLLTGSGLQSVAASLDVAKNALRVDAAAIGLKKGLAGTGSAEGGAEALAAVPAGSWLGFGMGDVGGTFKSALTSLSQAGATGGVDPATLMSQLKSQLGIDVEKDLLAWMGNAALFVRGSGVADLGGALVVTSKDPAASKAAIPKLKKLLSGLQVKTGALGSGAPSGADGFSIDVGSGSPLGGDVEVASKDDKFVIAYGKGALADALAGGDKLGDSEPFKTAAGLLEGVKPAVFVDTPAIVKLVSAFVGNDEDFAKAKPTLDVFGPAAAGIEQDGDVTRFKAAVAIP
jgi:uncharacterized protein DUF3352